MAQPRQGGPFAGGDGSTAVAAPAGEATTIALPADVVLSVRDVWIEYWARRGMVKAIRGVSFDLHRGESLALIGESGSGKTTLALALIRLLARAARVPRGHI